MLNKSIPNEDVKENATIAQFLDNPNQESFGALSKTFAPQLVAFFRSRSRELSLAEDLAQQVMLTVYRKAGQVRDRASFRPWLFKIARNALCRHYDWLSREVETVNLADVDNRLAAATHEPGGTPAFEFRDWMAFLDAHERDDMLLRFVEEREYHEIAAVRGTPSRYRPLEDFQLKEKACEASESTPCCAPDRLNTTQGRSSNTMLRHTLLNPNRAGKRAEELRSKLRTLITGQNQALDQTVDIYHTYLIGLSTLGRPIGNFLWKRTFVTPFLLKPERRRVLATLLAAALLILVASLKSKGAELNPATLNAWNAYVQAQNARVAEYSSATPFLWSDQSPDRLRHLHNGETVIAPFGENPHKVPHGLIHHWIGAVFLPGARLDDVISVVRDYGKYKDFYAPNVIDSRVSRQMKSEDTFSLRILNKAVVAKFALDTDFQCTYRRLDENKWYSISYTTRVREVENYGLADEHEAPANTGSGLIWRMYSISRFEQRDGGMYVELEAVVLSRDIPGALRWIVDPIVRRTSRSAMDVSLQKTEGAVVETSRIAKNNEKNNTLAKAAFSNKPAAQLQNPLGQ